MLNISLPAAKIAGNRVLFGKLSELQGARALEAVTMQHVRGHVAHFKAPDALWKFLTGPTDLMLRYTDEKATWVSFPIPEVWVAFWDSLSVIFDQMRSEFQRRQIPQGHLIRLLTADQRLSVRLNHTSARFLPAIFSGRRRTHRWRS